ncbi:hypothetical protein TNCV_4970241 [Trichonephila clavipes]|uniref:Glucose-methanol-choline oxidoreductase C-terminal domain-containing protein n=1 Tax=Trichonephila clavipes TaxID=2585209 RepID=A0A8X6V865_TRICX|nr:hypothetical protein TNCV_4970241 [Trichonephila clavipes]
MSHVLQPKSRGEVTLRSSDPYDPPIIDPKYFSHPEDMKNVVAGHTDDDPIKPSFMQHSKVAFFPSTGNKHFGIVIVLSHAFIEIIPNSFARHRGNL